MIIMSQSIFSFMVFYLILLCPVVLSFTITSKNLISKIEKKRIYYKERTRLYKGIGEIFEEFVNGLNSNISGASVETLEKEEKESITSASRIKVKKIIEKKKIVAATQSSFFANAKPFVAPPPPPTKEEKPIKTTEKAKESKVMKVDELNSKEKVEKSTLIESSEQFQLSRRQSLELGIGGSLLGISFLATRENEPTDYGLYGVLPVGPYTKTKYSYFDTIVPDTIWTVDQKFGILNVQVPLRMTIIKLESTGGLFVYNPVAATPEVVSFLRELCKKYNTFVSDIVVGSVAAEHKVYASVLAQKFPKSKVWLTEGQYTFPVNLPNELLGFPIGNGRTNILKRDGTGGNIVAWKDELQYLTLGPFISRDGAFSESVFLHKPTKTLICTDSVLEVTEDVPDIYKLDPAPLLFHARDTVSDIVEDTKDVRERGWRRIVLFGLFFTPSAIEIKDGGIAFAERRPDISTDYFGIYPWDWVGDDIASFKALQGGLLVAPILQKLILNRNPVEVLDFADTIATWDFERIIPSHLKNNLAYKGKDYRRAFDFLTADGPAAGYPNPLPADFKTLDDANVNLIESGAINVIPPFPGGEFSRKEILAQEAYGCRAGICGVQSSP